MMLLFKVPFNCVAGIYAPESLRKTILTVSLEYLMQ